MPAINGKHCSPLMWHHGMFWPGLLTFWAPYLMKAIQKALESTIRRWPGWPGQKGGDPLDVRKLKKGMLEILKILNSLDNVRVECVARSRLLGCWWTPFEIWEQGVLNKNKEVPLNTVACERKPLPQVEPWDVPEPFVARLCLISARSARLSWIFGILLGSKTLDFRVWESKIPLFSQSFHQAEIFLFLTVFPFLLTLGICGPGKKVSSILYFSVWYFMDILSPDSAWTVFILTFSLYPKDMDF